MYLTKAHISLMGKRFVSLLPCTNISSHKFRLSIKYVLAIWGMACALLDTRPELGRSRVNRTLMGNFWGKSVSRYVEIRMYIDLPIHNKEWVVLNFGKNILASDFNELVIDMVKMETSYWLMIYVEKFTYWLS